MGVPCPPHPLRTHQHRVKQPANLLDQPPPHPSSSTRIFNPLPYPSVLPPLASHPEQRRRTPPHPNLYITHPPPQQLYLTFYLPLPHHPCIPHPTPARRCSPCPFPGHVWYLLQG
eukprot:765088-Hanusia_phi.AAC.4